MAVAILFGNIHSVCTKSVEIASDSNEKFTVKIGKKIKDKFLAIFKKKSFEISEHTEITDDTEITETPKVKKTSENTNNPETSTNHTEITNHTAISENLDTDNKKSE